MRHFRLALALLIAFSQLGSPSWAVDANQAARFYEDALKRFESKDPAGAIVQLKNALQQDPSYLSAYLLMGQAQLSKGDPSGAELSLTTALKMGADRMEVLGPLAEAYMRQRKFSEVLEKIEPSGLPVDVLQPLLLTRAYAYLALGKLAEASQTIDQAAALSPNAGNIAVARGMYHLQRGDLTEARQFADRAIAITPKDPRAWNLKASIAHVKGDADGALDGYGRALDLAPDFLDVLVARAGVLIDLNRFDEAFKHLAFLKEKFPEEPRAAYLRSLYYERKDNPKAARAELLQAAKEIGSLPSEFVNSDAQALMLGALTNYSLKAYEQAQNYIVGYIRLNPGDPGARKLLGSILLARGQNNAAITQLENASRAAPRDPQIMNMLASAYVSNNQYTKAANLLEQAGPMTLKSPQLAGTLGFSLLGLGRQEQGIEYLSQAYAKNPADFRLGSSLVMLDISRGKVVDAVRVAESFRAKHPKEPNAYNLLGVAKAAARDVSGARGAYEKALSMAPDFHAARLNLAKLEASQGKLDTARQQIKTILAKQSKHPQAQYELGVIELAAGRPAEALRWLQGAQAQNPGNTLFAVKLIDTYLAQGQADKALALAKQTSASAPDNFDVSSALGRAHAALGQMSLAQTAFSRMSKIAGFDVPRLEETARLQLMANDLSGAALSLNKALGDQPGAIQANLLMAELERRRGQSTQAFERIKQITAANPRSSAAQRGLGDAHMTAGQYGPAAQAYRTALSIEDSADLALRYQNALRAEGNAPQALSFLEDWSRRHPQVASIRSALGEAQLRAGQLPKARATYESYLKKFGDHPDVLNNLANILARLGEPSALDIAQRAYRIAPGDYAVNDTLGWLLLRQGQDESALRYLREAKLRGPRQPEVRYHLAVALSRTGHKGEARNELEQILRSQTVFEGRAEAEKLFRELAASR